MVEIDIMGVKKLQWNSLLNMTELKFEPEELKQLTVTDELVIAISWLTAATKHDRKLLRCDENGALLTTDPWTLLVAVENDVLSFSSGSPDTFTASVQNKGVLIATCSNACSLTFVRVEDGAEEIIYVPANWLYWYPHTVYSVTAANLPAIAGADVLGLTTFN